MCERVIVGARPLGPFKGGDFREGKNKRRISVFFYLEKNTPPQKLHVVPGFFLIGLAYQGKGYCV